MTLRQRQPRQRDDKHLAFVRAQPCCVCGSTRNVEAAHLKLRLPEIGKEMPGMAEKADDSFVTPLCHYHHQSGILAQHKIGEQRFWFEVHGRNPFEIAARLWIESGGAARALDPKAAKRPRKIKARDRITPKRQIPGRALQSRSTWPQRKLQSRNTFERREAR
jgi:hypothetical protein